VVSSVVGFWMDCLKGGLELGNDDRGPRDGNASGYGASGILNGARSFILSLG
jgi:hypothetical protein